MASYNEATNICQALNDGVHFSDQTVPLYYLEKALAVTETSTATVATAAGLCAAISSTNGYTLSAWVLPTAAGGVLTLKGTVDTETIQVYFLNSAFRLGNSSVGHTVRLYCMSNE